MTIADASPAALSALTYEDTSLAPLGLASLSITAHRPTGRPDIKYES